MSAITCSRCGQPVPSPRPAHRVPFAGPDKERVLASDLRRLLEGVGRAWRSRSSTSTG